MGWRRGNPDERIRELERRAQLGDPEARAQLEALTLRSGTRAPQRKFLVDLAGEVLEEIGPGGGLASRAGWLDRKIHAAALKAVLKAIGVKASVTTPNYSMANSVEIAAARKVPGAFGSKLVSDYLNFDEARTIWEALGLESWMEPLEEHRATWRGLDRFSIYPNAREDRSDILSDYFAPGGPRLREDLWGIYKGALRKELAKPPRPKRQKKNPDAEQRRRERQFAADLTWESLARAQGEARRRGFLIRGDTIGQESGTHGYGGALRVREVSYLPIREEPAPGIVIIPTDPDRKKGAWVVAHWQGGALTGMPLHLDLARRFAKEAAAGADWTQTVEELVRDPAPRLLVDDLRFRFERLQRERQT